MSQVPLAGADCNGGISHVVAETPVTADEEILLRIELTPIAYDFCALLYQDGTESRCPLGQLQTRVDNPAINDQ